MEKIVPWNVLKQLDEYPFELLQISDYLSISYEGKYYGFTLKEFASNHEWELDSIDLERK